MLVRPGQELPPEIIDVESRLVQALQIKFSDGEIVDLGVVPDTATVIDPTNPQWDDHHKPEIQALIRHRKRDLLSAKCDELVKVVGGMVLTGQVAVLGSAASGGIIADRLLARDPDLTLADKGLFGLAGAACLGLLGYGLAVFRNKISPTKIPAQKIAGLEGLLNEADRIVGQEEAHEAS